MTCKINTCYFSNYKPVKNKKPTKKAKDSKIKQKFFYNSLTNIISCQPINQVQSKKY